MVSSIFQKTNLKFLIVALAFCGRNFSFIFRKIWKKKSSDINWPLVCDIWSKIHTGMKLCMIFYSKVLHLTNWNLPYLVGFLFYQIYRLSSWLPPPVHPGLGYIVLLIASEIEMHILMFDQYRVKGCRNMCGLVLADPHYGQKVLKFHYIKYVQNMLLSCPYLTYFRVRYKRTL